MSDDDNSLGLDRGGSRGILYSSAIAFLVFVPGTALILFGQGSALILPSSVIEFAYPYSIPWPEQSLLTTVTAKFDLFGKVTLGDIGSVDLFIQQFFVLAIASSFLVLAILTFQARARYLYPLSSKLTIAGYLKVIAMLVLLREIQVCSLVGKAMPLNSSDPKLLIARLVLSTIAPEGLILTSCAITIVGWTAALLAYRLISAPLN